jgi:DNA-binding XRE family transcriptional regulator
MSHSIPFPLVVLAIPQELALARTEFSWLPSANVLVTALGENISNIAKSLVPHQPKPLQATILFIGKAPNQESAPEYVEQLQRYMHEISQDFRGDFHGMRFCIYAPTVTQGESFEMGKLFASSSALKDATLVESNKTLQQFVYRTIDVLEAPPKEFSIEEARKRLGFTQDQMAKALEVTPRTIRNWEKGQNLSQMGKKVEQLQRLLELMDHNLVEAQEKRWLETHVDALEGRTPREAILNGGMEELIVEFIRLEEGMPV